ncbi:helix-turn-helix transcriptional regulator [Nonomuraea longicatena]|uniref:HTH cro/C1-type domain-containing protein n=1 Tax=Nonomuraea longicatena TaxID=83682 RepID=A0ABP3ZNR4_9ACTN
MIRDIPSGESTGQRVAHWRKTRGFTQKGLAGAAHLSASYISKVEKGFKAPTPAFVSAVARALRVDPTLLYGQPFADAKDDPVQDVIPAIRRAFAFTEFTAPELGAPPRPVGALDAEARRLRGLQSDGAFSAVGVRLPALLEEAAVRAIETDRPEAWRVLNMGTGVAISMARRLGYPDLAQLGVEKAVQAARRADDSTLVHLTTLPLSLLMIARGEWDTALAMVRRAASAVDQTHPDGRAVYGSLHLRAAISAARAGKEGEAWEHHGIATEVAGELVAAQAPDTHLLMVNPANASIHGCAIAIDVADYDKAIRLDQEITFPRSLVAERITHHHVDMARAELWLGRHKQAFKRILKAEQLAPMMTRYHPTARETVMQMERHRYTVPEPLRQLMRRMGM